MEIQKLTSRATDEGTPQEYGGAVLDTKLLKQEQSSVMTSQQSQSVLGEGYNLNGKLNQAGVAPGKRKNTKTEVNQKVEGVGTNQIAQ